MDGRVVCLQLRSVEKVKMCDENMKNSDEILEKSKAATAKLIPLKSEERYNKEYKVFNEWRRQHEVKIIDEEAMSSVKILPYRKNVFYYRLHHTVKPNITVQYEIKYAVGRPKSIYVCQISIKIVVAATYLILKV